MASELAMMITGAGRVGPAALLALWRRRRTEIYIAELVQAIRSGQAPVAPELPAAIVANYRDLGGAQLSVSAASVEILNLLRPSVAVARFIVFAALALEENPEWREQLRGADDAVYDFFAEEVRRLYPFFPVIGGRVLKPFEWKGHHFREKDWVLLDLYGTDHDPGRFPDPDAFDPGRRLSWRHQDYSFVPQGGGDARCDHRCPGEQFTIVMIREAMRMLVEDVSYRVPDQNLSVPLNKMPTAPVSGYILTDITLQSD